MAFTYVPGVMTESEFQQFQIEVGLSDDSGTASLQLAIQPKSVLTIGDETITNDSDDFLYQDLDTNVSNGVVTGELICYGPSEIDTSGSISMLNFIKETIVTIFEEPFSTAISIEIDTNNNDGFVKTPYYNWIIFCLPEIGSSLTDSRGMTLSVDNKFQFDLDMSIGYLDRGIYMYPTDLNLGSIIPIDTNSTEFILNTNSVLTDFDYLGVPEYFWDAEGGYYGIWVVGNDADLWLDLRDPRMLENEYYVPYPEISPEHGQTTYSYTLFGSGEHSIDLSVYDEYLGGGIQYISIELYIHTNIG